jgi:ubiquinone/menaquinone biosynthesis C-methylase UbiE
MLPPVPPDTPSGEVPRADRVVGLLFRAWSAVYDQPIFQRPFYRRVHAAVLRAVDGADAAPRRVLDVGCGTAQLTADLAACFPGAAVVGLDISPAMLAAARRRLGAAAPALVRANVYALPIATGAADLVTSTISYHWYLEPDRALAEIRRLLRPGGVFILATLAPPLVRGVVARQRLATTDDHLRDLGAAGFEVAEHDRVWPLVRVFTAIRR